VTIDRFSAFGTNIQKQHGSLTFIDSEKHHLHLLSFIWDGIASARLPGGASWWWI
jgi:hypothetical protein